jgi:transposase
MNANNRDRELAVVSDIKDVSLTLRQVAVKHGISYSTVAKLTKKYNLLSLREPGRPWGSKKAADAFTKTH